MASKVSQEGASGLLHADIFKLNGGKTIPFKVAMYDEIMVTCSFCGKPGDEKEPLKVWLGTCNDTRWFYHDRCLWDEMQRDDLEEEEIDLRGLAGDIKHELIHLGVNLPSTHEVIDSYLSYMEDGGAAEGYLTVRARKLRFFARQYPELPTNPEVIHAYLRQFKTRDVPTRQDQWKALSALYKFASDTYSTPNRMLKVEKPRFKKKPGQRLSRDQARLLLPVLKTDLEWALVTCYFGLRFRRVEAERLQLGDVKTDYLIVRGKERTEELPLLPVFRDKLLRFDRGQSPGDPLFPIKGDTMAYHIKQIFRRVGIAGARTSPHTLRNTAGALWSTFGGDWTSNRQLLRHSEQTMTDHYSPLTIDELRAKDERHNPMLNLMRELGLAPGYTNTSSVRETFADPEKRLPELLDRMIALGEMTHELKRDLGGNGHWPDQAEEITQLIEEGKLKP